MVWIYLMLIRWYNGLGLIGNVYANITDCGAQNTLCINPKLQTEACVPPSPPKQFPILQWNNATMRSWVRFMSFIISDFHEFFSSPRGKIATHFMSSFFSKVKNTPGEEFYEFFWSSAMVIVLVSRYSWIPSGPSSRPCPDSLYPPNGV